MFKNIEICVSAVGSCHAKGLIACCFGISHLTLVSDTESIWGARLDVSEKPRDNASPMLKRDYNSKESSHQHTQRLLQLCCKRK